MVQGQVRRAERAGHAQQRGPACRQGGDQRLPEAAAVQDRRDRDAEGRQRVSGTTDPGNRGHSECQSSCHAGKLCL